MPRSPNGIPLRREIVGMRELGHRQDVILYIV